MFFNYLFQVVLYCIDLNDLSKFKLGVRRKWYISVLFFFCNFVVKSVNFLFGLSYYSKFNINQTKLVDSYGILLFDRDSVNYDTIILTTLLNDICSWTFSREFCEELVIERYVAMKLYSYTNKVTFYSGSALASTLYATKNMSWILNTIEKFNMSIRYDKSIPARHVFFENLTFRHSLFFEFIWAVGPTIIITYILIPSLILLYSSDGNLDPKYTFHVIGNQWYWSYEFHGFIPVNGEDNFVEYLYDSFIVGEDDLDLGMKRLLEVDQHFVVPFMYQYVLL